MSTASCAPGAQQKPDSARFGAEWESHSQTVMSWPSELIWEDDVPDVREDIARIARAIAEFEPLVMLVSPGEEEEAQRLCGERVNILTVPVDDLWARDTLPVFVESSAGLSGVDFNFNGWGEKQQHGNDKDVASAFLSHLNINRVQADLVGEAGSLETDGQGTLLVTESSMVNQNRNPGLDRAEIEKRLKDLLGVKKVIWFDGVYGKDITDAHIDSLVRFVAPGVVLLDTPGPGAPDDEWAKSSAQASEVLSSATDAHENSFKVIDLPQPDFAKIRGEDDDFLASYVNFYIGNGAVYVPEFGDAEADKNAQDILQEHFPDRDIVAIGIDTVASGGGGIHCATHDIPGNPEQQ